MRKSPREPARTRRSATRGLVAAVTVGAAAVLLYAVGCGGDDVEQAVDAGPEGSFDAQGLDVAVDAPVDGEDAGAVDAGPGDASDASDGAASPPASCTPGGPGMTNCGAGGDGGGNESCCASLPVTGGTFDRTYTNDGSGATGKGDPATVSSFRLDKYDVTVGRFRQFVAAWDGGSGWLPPAGSGKHTHLNGGKGLENGAVSGTYEAGWDVADDAKVQPTTNNLSCDSKYPVWTDTPGANENLPMTCMNWYEAYAFCIWDGGFLPSATEWEYAAAGGSDLRQYPWGNAALGTTCPGAGCSYAIYGCYYPNGSGACTSAANIANVGTAAQGAGAWGQLDLAGNVWEWNLDWYATSYQNPCTDCADLTPDIYRAARGGYFGGGVSYLLPTNLSGDDPTGRGDGVGLRCARAP